MMSRPIMRALRAFLSVPAWAVHFHDDLATGESVPCYDTHCRRPPLSVDYRLGE
jgi:hypothetical protein